jgi:D-sedoheptulose 7-phosphate isomerase
MSRAELLRARVREAIDVCEALLADDALGATVDAVVDALVTSIRSGNKVMLCGNGGSAADAQHIAGEFLSRLNFDRSPLPAVALTTDSSVLTAVGNDYGFEKVFERQIRGLARKGDVFIAISTSGRSRNIIRSLEAARQMGVKTIGFTGISDSEMVPLCDLCLRAPSDSTPQIQQIHIVAAHAICGVVESELFGKS